MDKDEIIQTYKQAKTLEELEAKREEARKDYNKLYSYEQRKVNKVYTNLIMELK